MQWFARRVSFLREDLGTSHGLLCIYIPKHLSERMKHLHKKEIIMCVSQYRMHKVRDTSKLVGYVTIVEGFEPLTEEDYVKLVRLAHKFRKP
ncbi:MAG: hypothetical protein QXP38_10740 [Nitrososphaerota archaeon]